VGFQIWATLYNRVGVVKRHVDRRSFFVFSFVEVFAVAFVLCSLTKARFQNLAVDHSVPPAIYSVT
jgi:hypothetical protein